MNGSTAFCPSGLSKKGTAQTVRIFRQVIDVCPLSTTLQKLLIKHFCVFYAWYKCHRKKKKSRKLIKIFSKKKI